jgi:hypothetical protein
MISDWVRPRYHNSAKGGVPKWLRERSAKPPCIGSNPIAASNYFPAGESFFDAVMLTALSRWVLLSS